MADRRNRRHILLEETDYWRLVQAAQKSGLVPKGRVGRGDVAKLGAEILIHEMIEMIENTVNKKLEDNTIELGQFAIYTISNKLNNKRYVGVTARPSRRKNEHFHALKSNKHVNPILQAEFNEYGAENFEWAFIEWNIAPQDVAAREHYWILHYNAFENGYNIGSPIKGRPQL